MTELTWRALSEFRCDGHDVRVEQAVLLPALGNKAIYRAFAELDGVRVHRHAPQAERAVCDLLSMLADIDLAEALEAAEDTCGAEDS